MTTAYIGIDTGGTFTDFVVFSEGKLHIHKCLSTPDDPARAIATGLRDLGLLDGAHQIVHGSTVVTNAILEGRGVKTVYITNRGFADVLRIGRQTRDNLYTLHPSERTVPLPREHCLETGGRLDAAGRLVDPLTDADLQAVCAAIKQLCPRSVAVNLLFSFVDPRFEQRIAEALPDDLFVSLSSDILPEYREYERGITTFLNAWIGPLAYHYLRKLQSLAPQANIAVMQSFGGTIAAEQAARKAIHLVLSGPAGGMAAATHLGKRCATPRLLSFDMGGTSTDVALIDGQPSLTTEGRIAGYPLAIPMINIHTIGAGGGSIAMVDEGGLIRVGPQSAGSDPGPACYGRGGRHATVTDANLVLGRLRADDFLGGRMTLDRDAAFHAVSRLGTVLGLSPEDTAQGIIRVANEAMAQALRVISVEQGYDPRDFSLISFGGAGGLHVCALADALGITEAILPIHAGVLSALGMLVAPKSRHLSRTVNQPVDTRLDFHRLDATFAELEEQNTAALHQEGIRPEHITHRRSIDARYAGQTHTLNIPWQASSMLCEAFHLQHCRRFGHRLDLDMEIVNLRVASSAPPLPLEISPPASSPSPSPRTTARLTGIPTPVPVWRRKSLSPGQQIPGPAVITEAVATTFLEPQWYAVVDPMGNLRLRRKEKAGPTAGC